MKVLIIGGLGYIGSHLTLALKKQGHKVDIIDNNSSANLDPKHLRLLKDNTRGIYWGDTASTSFFDAFKYMDYDAVYHFGEEKLISVLEDHPEYKERAIAGARNVLRLVNEISKKKICKLIYSSTSAIYGKKTVYAETKRAVEKLIGTSTMYPVILRFGNPIGCTGELSYKFFTGNALAENLLALHETTEPFKLHTNMLGMSTSRSYIFINSLINRCVSGLVNNVSGDVGDYNIFTKDLVEEYIAYHKLPNKIIKVPLRKGESHSIHMGDDAPIDWRFIIKYIR